jgi:hypothetical protein
MPSVCIDFIIRSGWRLNGVWLDGRRRVAGFVGLSKRFKFILIDPIRITFRPPPFGGSPIAA